MLQTVSVAGGLWPFYVAYSKIIGVCVCVYVYIYTHTHTHTYIERERAKERENLVYLYDGITCIWIYDTIRSYNIMWHHQIKFVCIL